MKLYIRNVWVIKFLSIWIDLILSLWSETHSSVKQLKLFQSWECRIKSFFKNFISERDPPMQRMLASSLNKNNNDQQRVKTDNNKETEVRTIYKKGTKIETIARGTQKYTNKN